MGSFYCLIAVGFSIVCCSTPTFAQENSTFQPGSNTFVGCKINTVNKTNNSTDCKLLIDKSKIEEVLSKHDNSTTTNTVKIKISVPGNKTRYFEELELAWASEIGRTIISLVRRAKDTIFTSPFFTLLLEVGTEEVDVEVTETTDGCLPPGDEGSDQIFDLLLHQLSHSEDKHVFKLCRAHDDESTQYATYNCCRIVGDRNLPICADYSSVVVTFAFPTVIVVFFISFFMVLPFVFEHIITYPTVKFYKTSESHMSLVSMLSKVFFEGRGPAKSFFRRCVFAGLSSLVFLPNFFGLCWLQWLFIAWLIAFVLMNDDQMTNEKVKDDCIKIECKKIKCAIEDPQECTKKHTERCKKECRIKALQCGKMLISCFTIPFNFFHNAIWPIMINCCSKCAKRATNCCKLNTPKSDGSCCDFICDLLCNLRDSLKGLIVCILLICFLCLYLLSVIICLAKFSAIDLTIFFIWPHHRNAKCLQKVLCPLRFLTLVVSVFFTGMIFVLALSIVVGLTLNAEYFSPFIAPILTLMIYCWNNWKYSVEAKSLQLKTSIIEVCKEKARATENEQNSPNIGTTSNIENFEEKDRDKESERNSSNIGTNSNEKNNNKQKDRLARKVQKEVDRFRDFLCSCARDTSKDPHTRKTWRKTCCCCCRDEASTTDHEDTELQNKDTEKAFGDMNGEELTIEFDKHGEAMISTKLYKKIRKKILHLDHILFYFFRRVIFVGLYVFGMITVMIVARDSGVF